MVGHNPFNPSARDRVFPATEERDIGVLVMFAVRKSLASADGVRRVVDGLDRARGARPAAPSTPTIRSGSSSTTAAPRRFAEAAYRFARHEPGCHVVLTGTGSVDHLAENVAAINGPPLPLEHQKRLQELFGHIDCVSGD